ncbi:MAG: hypothetical protein QM758_10715 [Armatimonas sp.]
MALRYVKNFKPPSPFAPPTRPLMPADVGLSLSEVRLVGRSEGRRAWTLSARTVEGTRNRSRLTMRGNIEAVPLEKDGKTPQANIKAPQAAYDTLAKTITAEGGVEVLGREKGQPKARVKAPRAAYDLKGRQLSAEGGVAVTLIEKKKNRATLFSPTLTYGLEKKLLTASGGFLATLLDAKPATLAGPLALWDAAGQVLTCPQGVTLRRGTLVVDNDFLKADLKRGIYSSKEGHGSFHIDEIKEFTP